MSDQDEYRRLLETVSQQGLKRLGVQELEALRVFLEATDYSGNKKADKSKKKLLTKINAEIYNRHNPRRLF
ncbi:MAG: hypothetical protein ABI347_03200 [Nitrososphaera sp.]